MIENRSADRGAVFPRLVYDDVDAAIAWLCAAFGFSEKLRYGAPGRSDGAQLNVGTGSVSLTRSRTGQSPGWNDAARLAPPRPGEVCCSIGVRVENIDAHHARALAHGARIVGAPQTYMFGERQYTAEDLAGYRWGFTESVADVAPETWGGRVP